MADEYDQKPDRCPTGHRGRHSWATYADHERRVCLDCGMEGGESRD